MENPFLVSGYIESSYFCDRKKESKRIISSIKNGGNMTLISLRKMGKTGLIHHVFYQLNEEKDIICLYLDLMSTTNLTELIELFGTFILGKLESSPVKLLKKLGNMVFNLKTKITFDALTGIPSIEFKFEEGANPSTTLEQIFDYLEKQNKKLVIALDEFQQISNYPEKNVEALLRSYIQNLHNVCFIFSGSSKHILTSMFGSYSRPFYNSTNMLYLEKINKAEYIEFIRQKFEKGRRKVSDTALEYIISSARNHTYYVQYLCNRLWAMQTKNIDVKQVNMALVKILEENEHVYFNYLRLITIHQIELLKAIAKGKKVDKPMSKDFIKTYNLGSASTVRMSLHSLLNKELIFEEEGFYYIYDVFFSLWLGRL